MAESGSSVAGDTQFPAMKVQWQGDNLAEVERLLDPFQARGVGEGGTDLVITGIDGLFLEVGLGDSLKIRGDSLGVERLPFAEADPFVVWQGDNAGEISTFIKPWAEIQMSVLGNQLILDWIEDGQKRCILERGDRLVGKGRCLFVSRAGEDHRA